MKGGKILSFPIKAEKDVSSSPQNELKLVTSCTVEDTNLSLPWLRGEFGRGLSTGRPENSTVSH